MNSIEISAPAANLLRFEDIATDYSGAQYRVVHRDLSEQKRWTGVEEVIFEHLELDMYFRFYFEYPLTEMGEYRDFESPVVCNRVFKKEKMVVYYE